MGEVKEGFMLPNEKVTIKFIRRNTTLNGIDNIFI